MEGATSGWTSPSDDVSPAVCGGGGGGRDGTRKALIRVGWRRVTLYVILLSLIVIVFLNIGLTFWILTVLRFSADGIGPIRIVQGGIQLSERIFITDQLVASTISTSPGRPLSLLSYRNFSTTVFDEDGNIDSQFVIKRNGIEVIANSFHISDTQGRNLFSAEGGEVHIGAELLSVAGEGGVAVNTSMQTPLVRADAGHDLVLESQTRSLKIKAPQDITLESTARGITANALDDIRLLSAVGSVHLDASNVYVHNLTTARAGAAPAPPARHAPAIYQLCACSDGKLFLAHPDGICQTLPHDEVCR